MFQTMLETAVRVCAAKFGNLFLCEGEVLRHVAMFGAPPEFAELRRRHPIVRPAPNSILARTAATKQPEHVLDFRQEQTYLDRLSASVQLVEVAGARTVLSVPMIKGDNVIGTIAIYRRHVEPFTAKQIELVTTFADQAVIAIENARLFEEVQARTGELQETLEYQTATSEVLNVISRSPTNAQPVFDAIVESAARLCEAVFSVVWLYDGELLHYAAGHNFTPEVLDHIRKAYPKPPDRSVAAGRAILDGRISHVPDMLADPGYARELAARRKLASGTRGPDAARR